MHEKTQRWFSLGGERVRGDVFRVRCPIPGCRVTSRLLPEGVLPGMQYSVETVGEAISGYLDAGRSYQTVAFDFVAPELRQGMTHSTIFWGAEGLRSPFPTTIFRWMARFGAGTKAWWPEIAAATQERLSHPLPVPERPRHLRAKAKTEAKREQLVTAWYLLALLFLFAGLLEMPASRWPYALLRAPRRPACLDRTGWFALAVRAPP